MKFLKKHKIFLFSPRKTKKDEIKGLNPRRPWNYRNAVYVHQGAYENFIAYSTRLVTRKNPYTGLSMANDPAFCFISLLNENWVDVWRDNNSGGLGWKWKEHYINWCKKNGVPKEKYTGDIPMRKKFLVEFQDRLFFGTDCCNSETEYNFYGKLWFDQMHESGKLPTEVWKKIFVKITLVIW